MVDVLDLPPIDKTTLTYRDEQALCAQKEGLNGNPDITLLRKSASIDTDSLKTDSQDAISFRNAICSQITNLSEAWEATITSNHSKKTPSDIVKNGTTLTIQTSGGQAITYKVKGKYAPDLLTTIIWHAFPGKQISQ